MTEPQSTHSTREHALYRFYSATGQLLYIGITLDPGNRWKQHAKDKPWWADVAGISVENHPDRASVLAAEARAIEVEKPLYNKVRPSLGRKAPRPSPPAPVRELVWLCEACGQPVADGTGYIHVNNIEVTAAQRAWADYDQRDTNQGEDWDAVLQLLDDEPRWRVHHASCDPAPEANDYWIDVARARTHAHLLQRTAHLLEKSWLEVTDWRAFIARAAGVDA